MEPPKQAPDLLNDLTDRSSSAKLYIGQLATYRSTGLTLCAHLLAPELSPTIKALTFVLHNPECSQLLVDPE